jgi:tetratricopeptide (TPR) repeat protein
MTVIDHFAVAADALRRRDYVAAVDALNAALAVDPASCDAWYNLGYAFNATQDYSAALSAYQAALDRGIAQPEDVFVNRAVILSDQLHRPGEAEAELQKALSVNPDFIPALVNLATIQEDKGDQEAARSVYQRILRLNPADGRALLRLTMIDIATRQFNPRQSIPLLEGALRRSDQAADSVVDTAFALANAYDADANYRSAFELVLRANEWDTQLRPEGARYNPRSVEALAETIRNTIPSAPDDTPPEGPALIFVCGLFRSGSTLAEQILGRHPSILAGGERDHIPRLALQAGQALPGALGAATPEQLTQWRHEYFAAFSDEEKSSEYLTDKRCDNFLHIGFIKTLFPSAHIIHTTRNPLDTLISTLFLRFGSEVKYGGSIEYFIHWYSHYRRIMRHWQSLYGKDIIELDYDALVVDPDAVLRPVFMRLGLPWDQSRMVPTDQKRILTASNWHVRQPVHRQSSGRWRHYRDWLPSPENFEADY